MKDFHLGDILTITHDQLVSPSGVESVYDILEYMTGERPYTHQLRRTINECTPALLEQHPQLAGIDASNVNKDNWQEWLDEQIAKYGEFLSVEVLGSGRHVSIDPALELEAKMRRSGDTASSRSEPEIIVIRSPETTEK